MFTSIFFWFIFSEICHNVIEEIKPRAKEEMYSGFHIYNIYIITGVRWYLIFLTNLILNPGSGRSDAWPNAGAHLCDQNEWM